MYGISLISLSHEEINENYNILLKLQNSFLLTENFQRKIFFVVVLVLASKKEKNI